MTESNLIAVARTNGAYGVRGWIRIVPFENGEVLAETKRWAFTPLNTKTTRDLTVLEIKIHGMQLMARIEGVDSKEAADALRGTISVSREDFPELEDGEHWAADVLGCRVVNEQGVELGRLTEIGNNGVQDIFKVEGGPLVNGKTPVYLIPDVEQYVLEIDDEEKVITVDWQPDWL